MSMKNDRKKATKLPDGDFTKKLRASGVSNNVPYTESIVQDTIVRTMQKMADALGRDIDSRPMEDLQEAITLIANGLHDKTELDANPAVVIAKFTTHMAETKGLVIFDSPEQKEAFTAELLRDTNREPGV